MDTTVRATCPKCRNVLRIPAQWVGQAVKCKKCGSVVRSKPKGDETAPEAGTAEAGPLESTPHPLNNPPVPAGDAFDFNQPSAEDDFFPLPEPLAPPVPEADDRFDPTGGADASSHPAPAMPGMPPGYPYPMPPGYPPPGAYGAPPGYPYAPPPGYGYPMPPGYPPPGYGYPMPPGYAPPGAYGTPPGYPYGTPPGAMPPTDPNAASPYAPAAPYPYSSSHAPAPAPVPAAPPASAPIAPTIPAAKLAKPASPSAMPAAKGNAPATGKPGAGPRSVVDPVPPSNEFKTDAPVAPGARRYRKNNGKGKMIWVVVCLFLTAGLVAGGIFGAKYLSEKYGSQKKEPEPNAKLVAQLGSSDAAERDHAYKTLKEMGDKAEAALKEGTKSDNAEVAKRSNELLTVLAVPKAGGPGGAPVSKNGPFPRRMLFMHISRYMYLNPLTYAQTTDNGGVVGEDRTKPAAIRLAHEWNITYDPKDTERSQLYVLSDTARPSGPKDDIPIPMKNVVMGAYERFFETSRAQDRIVIYFGGHVWEKDGKVLICPAEADPDEVEPSMIPLEDFYGKLKACKTTQKVVIWDVCRFNPDRGRQRPGSDPMTEGIHKALATPPEGVEVIVTCGAGENALEFNNLYVDKNAQNYAGSSFLESMRYVISKNNRPAKQPLPADPIPVAEWSASVAKRTAEVAERLEMLKTKQTVKLEGKMKATQVAYNSEEPLAKRFEWPQAPKGVPASEIVLITDEFRVPAIKSDVRDSPLQDIAFKEEVMKDYKADVPLGEILKDKEKYKFRVTTWNALVKIRKLWDMEPGATGGPTMRKSIPAPVSDKLKTTIKNEQEFWAIGIAELELMNVELDGIAAMKDAEPKRWQANYDYACAVIKTRLAFMNEYNKLMGDALTETLPSLDAKLNQDSYNLVSSEKMKSKKDVQKIAEEAKEAYEKLITNYKGTPWAIQAKREKSFTLGLAWQPATSSAGTTEK